MSRKLASVCNTEHNAVKCSIYMISTNTTGSKHKPGYNCTMLYTHLGRRFNRCWQKACPLLQSRQLALLLACYTDDSQGTVSRLLHVHKHGRPSWQKRLASQRSQLKPLTVERKQFKSHAPRAQNYAVAGKNSGGLCSSVLAHHYRAK
jgi:hypothetical protein